MKKTILNIAFGTLATSMLLISCKKEKTSSTTPAATITTTTPVVTSAKSNTFVWNENGGSEITADSAYWTTGQNYTGVRAYKGGYSNFFEINWDNNDNTSVGAKDIPTGTSFTFMSGQFTYDVSTKQALNITAFKDNKLSGNFDLNVSSANSGTITKIKATFTELAKK